MKWTGNQGKGTRDYKSYTRDHIYQISNKPDILGSSDPSFLGDKLRHNPEELLVASLSSCHMLWYLHLCATNGVVVTAYEDHASGTMEEGSGGSGRFKEVILAPKITIENEEKRDLAMSLHHEANRFCFIANSCNFPVLHRPEIDVR